VPYRLPHLVAAKAKANGTPWRVYIAEGEKDVDNLVQWWGVTATTNPMTALGSITACREFSGTEGKPMSSPGMITTSR
jgi:hypothetical protein